MSFEFKRKESVRKAIRRLGCERVENAIECLEDCKHAEAIHCARKDIKKARAILRLAKAQISRKEYSRIAKLLREAAANLGPARDAYIKAEALKTLVHRFKDKLSPDALRHTREQLRDAFEKENREFGKRKTALKTSGILRTAGKEFESLKLQNKGWKALQAGIEQSYGDGQSGYRLATKNPAPEDFHEWRKRVKDLYYHITMLQPLWPEQLDAMGNELKKLGECLGEDHDLFVVSETVKEFTHHNGSASEVEILNGLIQQRQSELRKSALALGKRFYTEKPSAFCNRLAGYGSAWRHEKPRANVLQAA